jgi:hypothetical protein
MKKYLGPVAFVLVSACAGQGSTTALKAAGDDKHPYESGTQFACMAPKSQVFFDIKIEDVGDQTGSVDINAGGAPQSMTAYYSDGRFAFGKDGLIELPAAASFDWTIGHVKFGNVDETLYCQFGAEVAQHISVTLDSSKSAVGCVGMDSGEFYTLKVDDIGDQTGTIYVDDGGAPQKIASFYDSNSGEYRLDNGKSAIDLTKVANEWATGKTDQVAGISESLVCKAQKYND